MLSVIGYRKQTRVKQMTIEYTSEQLGNGLEDALFEYNFGLGVYKANPSMEAYKNVKRLYARVERVKQMIEG
jgi:hypothetical protein